MSHEVGPARGYREVMTAVDDSSPVAPDGRPLRVLVVEDESGIAEALVAAYRFRGWDADSVGTVT